MSIIDTSGWIDAANAGLRGRLAEEDQRFQRDRIRQQDEQQRNDQLLYGSLWDMISGQQPGTSVPPTDYTMGPPTLQQQQQQQAAVGRSGGMGGSPQIRDLLTRSSPQAGSRFIDDAYRVRRDNFLREEKQRVAQAAAQRYAPLIDEFTDPEDRSDFRMALEDAAAGVMPAEQLYEVVNQIRKRKQGRFDARVTAGWDPSGEAMGPPLDLGSASPGVVQRIRGWEQSRDMQGQRQDFASQQQEDRQMYGRELAGMQQQNRLGAIDHRAEVAARAKELSPQEFEQQVQDVMTSNPRAGRAEAEAYVRGRHDGLFNQVQPNISGSTRGGLTQADKDTEQVMRLELDARERQLRLVLDQVKSESDPKRKQELIQRANGMNSEVIQLEEALQEHLRTRAATKPPANPRNTAVPSSAAPAPTPQPTTNIPVVPPSPPGGNPALSQGTTVDTTNPSPENIRDMTAAVRLAKAEGLTDPAQIRARALQILSGRP